MSYLYLGVAYLRRESFGGSTPPGGIVHFTPYGRGASPTSVPSYRGKGRARCSLNARGVAASAAHRLGGFSNKLRSLGRRFCMGSSKNRARSHPGTGLAS
jgi:hypothetical protein